MKIFASIPRYGHIITIMSMFALLMASESCLPDTETYLCDSGRRCKKGRVCALAQDICIDIGGCGDGVASSERGEVCDDGNVRDGDGCSADCRSDETCGNGIMDIAVGETCDDGNVIEGDGCSPTCQLESCGNARLDPGEMCDDGNAVSGDGCKDDCTSNEICGNGIMDAHLGEECDLGQLPPRDTADCDSDCTVPICGDGHVNYMAGEQCDTAGDSEFCDADCTIILCGDGYINPAGEVCDPGADMVGVSTPECDADCTLPMCGDAYVNPMYTPPGAPATEQCDEGVNGDGVVEDTATCDSDCTLPQCGDSHVNAAIEECDDGEGNNLDEPNMCRLDCKAPSCGDGIIDDGSAYNEQCDDGADNADEPDKCRTSCLLPTCGDGIVDDAYGERCEDDSSCTFGEVCDSSCQCVSAP